MYHNGHLVSRSVAFASGSTNEGLDQMSAIELPPADHAEILDRLSAARTTADTARATAERARKRAQDAATAAENAAENTVDTTGKRQADVDSQIERVRETLDRAEPGRRERLGTIQDDGICLDLPKPERPGAVVRSETVVIDAHRHNGANGSRYP